MCHLVLRELRGEVPKKLRFQGKFPLGLSFFCFFCFFVSGIPFLILFHLLRYWYQYLCQRCLKAWIELAQLANLLLVIKRETLTICLSLATINDLRLRWMDAWTHSKSRSVCF